MPAPSCNVDEQFPNFDNTPLLMALIRRVPGAQDASWQYDTSPCVMAPGVEIWVDFANIENRDFGYGKVFTLCVLDENGNREGTVCETDSIEWAVSLASIIASKNIELIGIDRKNVLSIDRYRNSMSMKDNDWSISPSE